jgi:F420-dependent oxidoreductase-like protein
MAQRRIGVAVAAPDSAAALASIEKAEQLGISAAWLTSGSAGGADNLTLLASAAMNTQRIMLGTAVTQIFSRHPVTAVQQTQALAQLAPGRFRLGLGTSGQAGMERTFGVKFERPMGHLREYLRIVKVLLQKGSVDLDGRYYTAHSRIAAPLEVPVMAAALGARAYRLCGAEADGAISWVCPGAYLRDVALPAMNRGAERAGRTQPPLIAHAPVCVHDDPEEVRAAVRQQFGGFARAPFYQRMFFTAGFPEVSQQTWSDAMVDAVALSGNEAQVSQQIEQLFSWGATELLASPVPAGGDGAASLDRTLALLGQLARALRA